MNLSDIYGKKVISLKNATVFGTVFGVHIDKNTFAPAYISLSDDGNYILPVKDMYGSGDVVSTFAEPRSATDELGNTVYLAYGAETFDAKGKFLGNLTDYTFDCNKKNKRISTDSISLHPKKLIAANRTLVFNTGRQLPPKKTLSETDATADKSETAEAAATSETIEPVSVDNSSENAPAAQPETPKPTFYSERPNTATISPETLNFDFLLGRTTKRNISDLNGLLLIPIGTIISRHIIENARKNGKLSELAISSR